MDILAYDEFFKVPAPSVFFHSSFMTYVCFKSPLLESFFSPSSYGGSPETTSSLHPIKDFVISILAMLFHLGLYHRHKKSGRFSAVSWTMMASGNGFARLLQDRRTRSNPIFLFPMDFSPCEIFSCCCCLLTCSFLIACLAAP